LKLNCKKIDQGKENNLKQHEETNGFKPEETQNVNQIKVETNINETENNKGGDNNLFKNNEVINQNNINMVENQTLNNVQDNSNNKEEHIQTLNKDNEYNDPKKEENKNLDKVNVDPIKEENIETLKNSNGIISIFDDPKDIHKVNQDINDLFEDDMQSENDKDRNITIDIKHTLSTNIPEDSSPEDNIEFFGGDIEDLKNEIDLELKDNNFIEVPEYLSPMLNNLIKNVEAIKDLDEDIIHYDVCDICMSIEDILNFDFRHSVLITKTLWSWIRDRLPSCVPKSRAATIITFINGLSDLTEDLGRFRAFLRWTLNEQSCSFFFQCFVI